MVALAKWLKVQGYFALAGLSEGRVRLICLFKTPPSLNVDRRDARTLRTC